MWRTLPPALLLALLLRADDGVPAAALHEELRAIEIAIDAERELVAAMLRAGRPDVAEARARVEALEARRKEALARIAARTAADPPPEPPAAFAALLADPAWAAAEPPVNGAGLRQVVHGKTGLVFVLLPGGRYTMGWEEHVKKEARHGIPPRPVDIEPFLICRTECTQEAWTRGGGSVPMEVFPGDTLPIAGFMWTTYRSWCAENGLRLPTEEEWEYACRAGTRTRWHHGEDDARLGDYAWTRDTSDERPHPVATLRPNAWGLFDMQGNVSEFVGREEDKVGLIFRGGSFRATAEGCRAAYRYVGYSGGYVVRKKTDLGFRPAASLPLEVADPDSR